MIRATFRFLLFLLLTSVFSCEKDFITNCDDCTSAEPENVELSIYVDVPASSSYNLIIRIYEGNLEDNILIETYSMQSRDATYYDAQINKKYTVTATYTMGNMVYVAVDSALPLIRYVESECGDPCYYVYNKSLNLRLKYQ